MPCLLLILSLYSIQNCYPLQTGTLQGFESSCPLLKKDFGKNYCPCPLLKKQLLQKYSSCLLLKKQIKNKYFSCLLFLTTTGLFVHCTQNAVLCTLTHTVLIELLFLLASITHFFAKSKDMRGHHRTSFCTNIPAEILRPGCCLKLQFQFTCTTHLRGRQSGRGRHRSGRTLR